MNRVEHRREATRLLARAVGIVEDPAARRLDRRVAELLIAAAAVHERLAGDVADQPVMGPLVGTVTVSQGPSTGPSTGRSATLGRPQ